jgi:hypothetical protein
VQGNRIVGCTGNAESAMPVSELWPNKNCTSETASLLLYSYALGAATYHQENGRTFLDGLCPIHLRSDLDMVSKLSHCQEEVSFNRF